MNNMDDEEAEEWFIELCEDDPKMVGETLYLIYKEAQKMMQSDNLKVQAHGHEIKEIIADMMEVEQTPQQMGWVGQDGLP